MSERVRARRHHRSAQSSGWAVSPETFALFIPIVLAVLLMPLGMGGRHPFGQLFLSSAAIAAAERVGIGAGTAAEAGAEAEAGGATGHALQGARRLSLAAWHLPSGCGLRAEATFLAVDHRPRRTPPGRATASTKAPGAAGAPAGTAVAPGARPPRGGLKTPPFGGIKTPPGGGFSYTPHLPLTRFSRLILTSTH